MTQKNINGFFLIRYFSSFILQNMFFADKRLIETTHLIIFLGERHLTYNKFKTLSLTMYGRYDYKVVISTGSKPGPEAIPEIIP